MKSTKASRHRRSGSALMVAAFLCLMASPAGAGPKRGTTNWPGWRGGESGGVSTESNLPTTWSSTENVLWKTAIPGRGHSSPIVWGERIFLTTAIEGEPIPGAKAPVHMIEGKPWSHPEAMGADRKHTLKVLCLDRDTGKILWERVAYEGPVYDSRHRKASYASPTPVTDGKLVFAYFGSQGLYAYDFNGNLKWKSDLGKIGTQSVGDGSSPVLYGDLLILQVDNEDGANSFITALDKKSGRPVWRTERKGIEISWATPVLVHAKTRDELVTSGNQAIIAYDPKTGKELWRAAGLDSNAVPSSVAGNGMVYVFTGYPKKKVIAVIPGGAGDITGTARIAWTYDRGVAYVASPLLFGDYLYLVSDKGILTCLDARTGQVLYNDGRVPVPAFYMASLVGGDGKVMQFSEDGDTFVVRAGPKHEILSRNSLDEPIYATPAIAAGRIFIRTQNHLYAIGAPAVARSSSARRGEIAGQRKQ